MHGVLLVARPPYSAGAHSPTDLSESQRIFVRCTMFVHRGMTLAFLRPGAILRANQSSILYGVEVEDVEASVAGMMGRAAWLRQLRDEGAR